MGIETGDTIASLNAIWPLDIDDTHEGNDHLQLIKNVLQKSFPGSGGGGWTAPTTIDPEDLDQLDGVTGNVQTQINARALKIYLDKITDVIEAGEDGTPFNVNTVDVNGLKQSWNGGANFATVLNTENALALFHPVGSVLFTIDNVNPETRFPLTTWTPVAEGRFIASVGDHTDVNGSPDGDITVPAGNMIEGEVNHTLTEAEMPNHTHALSGWKSWGTINTNTHLGRATDSTTELDIDPSDIAATGGGDSHNNIPPGFGLYVWKRDA